VTALLEAPPWSSRPLQRDRFTVVGSHGYVVVASRRRGSSPRWWSHFEETASVSYAVAAILWGWVVAVFGFGWRFWCFMGGEVVDPTGSSSVYVKVVLGATSWRRPLRHGAWAATWIRADNKYVDPAGP
jgi:hypothetical protein